jgi:hypothetical protein
VGDLLALFTPLNILDRSALSMPVWEEMRVNSPGRRIGELGGSLHSLHSHIGESGIVAVGGEVVRLSGVDMVVM